MARRRDDDEDFEEEYEDDAYEEDEYEDDEYEDEYEDEHERTSFLSNIASPSFRRAILIPLILILFGFGAWSLWKKYREEVLNHPSYVLDPNSIQFTDPPEWVHGDVLAEVIRDGSLEQQKIHKPDLTVRVVNAFELHPWVKRVERMWPSHNPAKLIVELAYRKPIAMVALPDPDPTDNEAWLQPVDADGVLLPTAGFTAEYAETFPRIDVGETEPSGPPGTGWGDDRVSDAAKIAEVLSPDWEELKDVLYQIEVSSQQFAMADAFDFDIRGKPADFDIRGRPDLGPDPPGLIIRWGRAPGREQTGEPPAKAKLQKLKEWVNESLMNNQLPVGEIDVRSVRALQASKLRARHR